MRKMIRRLFLCLVAVCCFHLGAMAAQQGEVPDHGALWQSVQDGWQNVVNNPSLRENVAEVRWAAQSALEKLGLTDRAAVAANWQAYCDRTAQQLTRLFRDNTQ